MHHELYEDLMLFGLTFIGTILFLLIIGLRGICTRKPFLISSKWTFALIIICFLPQIFNSFSLSKYLGNTFGISQAGFFVLLLLFIYRAMVMQQTYVAYGVTDESLIEALHHVLKKMNLNYEETLASIKLPSVPAELQVSIQSWMGVGQVRIKNSKNNKLLNEIVHGLNSYFRETDVKLNKVIFVFYIVLGFFLLTMPIFIFNCIKHLPNK